VDHGKKKKCGLLTLMANRKSSYFIVPGLSIFLFKFKQPY
jgi:hypothetical protein